MSCGTVFVHFKVRVLFGGGRVRQRQIDNVRYIERERTRERERENKRERERERNIHSPPLGHNEISLS